MDFPVLHNKIEEKKSLMTEVAFYLSLILLSVIVFAWAFLNIKMTSQNQQIEELNKRMDAFNIKPYKDAEKEVLDYKKKLDDLGQILTTRKISSNVFSMIEGDTLPSVWFSGFSMSGSDNRITLTGEAETMEVFSRQVQVFEKNDSYIKTVTILGSQIQPTGKVSFSLQLILDPKIFNYSDVFLPTAVNTN